MAKDVEVSKLTNWGRPKRTRGLPAFLLSKEEREKLRLPKRHLRGRPKK